MSVDPRRTVLVRPAALFHLGCRATGPPASFWRNHRMKTSGLPCRATPDCDVVFTPADDKTLKLLLAAAAERDAHELAVHGYTHRVIEVGKPDFAAGPRGRRPRKEAAA